ncbi:Cilia- and flagella-associated protein 221 [Channa argus]|uniref:Cilia-and flagella-associated protein 221 n=1 Tax=Channa argus TaxID=215402 RepID=A0A6G1QUQ9_CHAAH|nr:Cilia- and flagella-associated protein 221 [Channa argus]
MEVALSGPQMLSDPMRKGKPLPLNQLVEESGSRASVPNHLLESKIYAKLKSNSLIEAEPPELHFSGFELGKDYIKMLKLINISSDVMNIHIIPTQTKHFQTSYSKKGEENLLIPVHAYPVIDDLHIPPHIHLAAIPLGQSVSHVIPLRCSTPIDFEFQVYVIQSHEAFTISPLAGVIPANGEVKIKVTFSPIQYETCQVTIQLVISQFNTKPYLCTITGSSAAHLAISQLERKSGHGDTVPAEYKGMSSATQVPLQSKTKHRSAKQAEKSKILKDQAGLKPLVDLCTPAGVAKMLIKDTNKISSKALKEAISSASTLGLQNKQMKEALFIKKVQQNVKEEQANQIRWHVHLGKDPMLEKTRRHIVEEREMALHEYMVKRGDASKEEHFAAGQPKLSSRRVLCEAGQAPGGAPSFQFYSSFQWELKQRALRLFQQAARKAHCNLVPMPVDLIDVTVTTHIPFFKLQVPQHYKLSGYKPLSAWEAFNSYIPTTLARPLRTRAPVELEPIEARTQDEAVDLKAEVDQQHEDKEEGLEARVAAGLTFTAPKALLRPFAANPLRIFNPAPGLQAYKPTPKYLESDLEYHLCPLPRYTNSDGSTSAIKRNMPYTQKKFLDRKEVIKGVMEWKNFDSVTLNFLSSHPTLTSDCAPLRSVDYNTDVLPLTTPPPLTALPDDLASLMDKSCKSSGVQLTAEMIRAEFLSVEPLISNSNFATGMTANHLRELQMEETCRSESNQMGKKE